MQGDTAVRTAREQYEAMYIRYVQGGASREDLQSLQVAMSPFLDLPYNNVFEIEGVVLMAALTAGPPQDSPIRRAAKEWIEVVKSEQIGG